MAPSLNRGALVWYAPKGEGRARNYLWTATGHIAGIGHWHARQADQGLTFRGLTFSQTAQVPLPQRDPKDTGTLDTNDCAVLLEGAEDCAIKDCRFDQTGGYGIRLASPEPPGVMYVRSRPFVGRGCARFTTVLSPR
jgi:hypothetical protein